MSDIREWKVSSQKLGGLPCIEHKVTKELCLAGERGQIYEFAPGDLRAIVYMTSDEILHRVSLSKLRSWVKRLGVPGEARKQLEFVNV